MDPDLGRYQVVWAAAGLSTTVFAVPPGTLRILANATVAPIAEERPPATADGAATVRPPRGVTAEPRNATITYPGGLRARWRWGGSGSAADVFALSEVGGSLVDLGPTVSADPDALCRAELRVEGPRGAWTVRFASLISDDPRALHWDDAGSARRRLRLPHLRPRDRDRRASAGTTARRRRSSRSSGRRGSQHVIVAAELETFAIEADGTVAWRVAHSDVVTAAELVGGRLVLTSFDGQVSALDPATGRPGRADLRRVRDVDGLWITGEDRRIRWMSRIDRPWPGPPPFDPARRGRARLTAEIASRPTSRGGSFGPFHVRRVSSPPCLP